MKKDLKISVVQMLSQSGKLQENAEEMYAHMQKAKATHTDVIVFPELQLCNYDMEAFQTMPASMYVTETSPVVQYLQEKCKELGIGAIIGACVMHDNGLCGNSSLIINQTGKLMGTYDKTSIWCGEAHCFPYAGKTLKIFDFDGFKIGMAICYDSGFPEHFRALAKAGADAVVSLNAFAHGDEEFRYHHYWPLRAIENTVYVISANAIGDAGTRAHFGKSKILDPNGRLLTEGDSTECMISARMTKKRIENVRVDFTYLQDIRTDIHGDYIVPVEVIS